MGNCTRPTTEEHQQIELYDVKDQESMQSGKYKELDH